MSVKFSLATKLARYPINGKERSLREIAAELEGNGYVAVGGKQFTGGPKICKMIL
jgi:hypothetical protein